MRASSKMSPCSCYLAPESLFMHLIHLFKINAPGGKRNARQHRESVKHVLPYSCFFLKTQKRLLQSSDSHWLKKRASVVLKAKKTARTRHQDITGPTQTATHSPIGSSESSAYLTCNVWDVGGNPHEHRTQRKKEKKKAQN